MVQNGSSMSTPSHDLVAFGATSFVGKILCRYLGEEFGAQGEMKWAAAGRSKAKLEELRSSLGAKAGTLPLISEVAVVGPGFSAGLDQRLAIESAYGPTIPFHRGPGFADIGITV
jgi:short subunit dehydrogenase-like uncharacterized protein